MLNRAGRQLAKHVLSLARAKLLYDRITLTRFTALYFFFALASCSVLSVLQGVTFIDNVMGVSVLSPFLKNITTDPIILLYNKKLQTCTSIPNQPGTLCKTILYFTGNFSTLNTSAFQQHDDFKSEEYDDDLDGELLTRTEDKVFNRLGTASLASENCIISLGWVGEAIEDGKREDVVTMLFQIWLFSLALVAILNESIPHLGAAFLGHLLNTSWAAYRIRSTVSLTHLYRSKILPGACGDMDVMGRWWDVRLKHSIPILVVNLVILVAYIYLSSKLYKVYANETFSRVGASPSIHRIYKIVLFFSVCLQLSGFFSIASTAMWLDKVCHSFLMELTEYVDLYMAAFIVTLVFQFPWLYLGWVCVRKECKVRFGIFCVISCILLALSSAFFSGPLYRYIFKSWPFFATITITAYLLLVTTSVLGVVCRLNFEKGLAHYLQVTDALEGVDFTPVSFPTSIDSDIEKNDFDLFKGPSSPAPAAPIVVQRPALSHREPRRRSVKERVSAIFGGDFYSKDPIKISSSPPLISELGPRPVFGGPRSSSMAPSAEPRPSIYSTKKSAVPKGKKDQSSILPVLAAKPDKPQVIVQETVLTDPPSRSSSVKASPILQERGLPANPQGEKRKESSAGTDVKDNDSSPKYAT